MGAGDFTPQTVRVAFFHREQEACFRCRRPLRFEGRGIGWSAHHRKPRGSGGTSNPAIASITNLLVLCGSGTTGCHGWVESHRAKAEEIGYLVSALGLKSPADTRVQRADGSWWMLMAAGATVECEGMGWA